MKGQACALLVPTGLLAIAAGCLPAVDIDEDETVVSPAPVAQFDPAQRVVPIPNALLVNPETGRLNLPVACGEEPGSAAEGLRRGSVMAGG